MPAGRYEVKFDIGNLPEVYYFNNSVTQRRRSRGVK
jgi:hypothetical protein